MTLRRVALTTAAGAAVVVGSLGLAACGSSDPAPTNSTPPPMETTMDTTGTTAAETAPITGGETVLVLDETTAGALAKAGITVAPASGSAAAGGGVSFPVTSGEAAADLSAGTIAHSGGLVFSNDKGAALEVGDFSVDLATGVLTATTADGTSVPLLNIDTAAAQVSEGATDETVVEGVSGTLTAEAAKALNDTFDSTTFVEGLPMGILALELKS